MNKKIVIIDDNSEVLSISKKMLELFGFEVSAHEDPILALKQIEFQMPDVIITDIQMHEIDGFEVVDQVRAIDPEIPIYLLSGEYSKRVREYELKYKNVHFEEKPIADFKIFKEKLL